MKRLLFAGLSVLLMSAATAPAVRAEVNVLGTPFHPAANPAADPGSRLAPSTPGAPTISGSTITQGTLPTGPKMLQETPSASPKGTAALGTLLHPAANPAANPGSRIAPGTPGAPRVSGR